MSTDAAAIQIVRAAEQFLEEHRERLVREYGEQILVIRDDTVHGSYPTFDEAVRAGYEIFGAEPFLAMAATEEEEKITPPASMMAMGLA